MLQVSVDKGEIKMLTRLLPEQISTFWDVIKYAVEESLPPVVAEHPDKMNRILSSALSGETTVWASYTKGEEGIKFEGIVLTQFTHDKVSETKNLLIYCLYGYELVNKDSWLDGLMAIAKYAKSRNCSRVIAYTNEEQIINVVNSLGGNTEYTFISFDLDKIV